MTKKDKILRQKYVEKMVSYERKASSFRKKIEMIDQKDKEEFRKQMTGKCFWQNSGSKEKPYWHGFARVDYFDEHFQPHGTIVNWIEDKEKNERVYLSIETKHSLFVDWLLNGKEISNKTFNKHLEDVKKHMI